jgi:hypothetical protein
MLFGLNAHYRRVKQKLELAKAVKRCFAKIGDLPEWIQTIILDYINATIENRVCTMEIILPWKIEEKLKGKIRLTVKEMRIDLGLQRLYFL